MRTSASAGGADPPPRSDGDGEVTPETVPDTPLDGPFGRPLDRAKWRPTPFLAASIVGSVATAAATVIEPGLWPWTAGFWAVDHAVAFVAGLLPQSRLLGPNLSRLPESSRRIALTFDDGPDPHLTPALLDLLDEFGARASFFVIGRRAARWPRLAQEIVARGHRLENHSWSHPHAFGFYSPRALARQVDRTQALLTELGGRRPVYFRAPAGIRSPLLEPVLAPRRLRLASWTRRGYDTVDKDPQRVARRLLRDLSAGDVLLLHDGRSLRRDEEASSTKNSSVSSPEKIVTLEARRTLLESSRRVLEACATAGLAVEALPATPPRPG